MTNRNAWRGREPRTAWDAPRLTIHGSLAQLTEKKLPGAFDGINMMPPGLYGDNPPGGLDS